MKKEYLDIRKKLEERIRENGRQLQKLPALRTLAKEFGCTAPTVMRAVQSLVANGLLAPRQNGGYTPIPQKIFGGERKIVAVITGRGMHVYDTAFFCLMRYCATYTLACSESLNVSGIANITLNTYDDRKSILQDELYSGLILVHPSEELLRRVKKICRPADLPVGIFGANEPYGQVTMTFDVKHDFAALFRKLAKMGRRRILVFSGYNYIWNEAMAETIREFSDTFESAEFYQGPMEQATEFGLRNIGKKGKKYDTAVFTSLIPGAYAKLKEQAPECLFVTNNCATAHEPDFHGLLMNFDVEPAGKIFGKDMHDAIWEHHTGAVHRTIPCDIRQIKKGVCEL